MATPTSLSQSRPNSSGRAWVYATTVGVLLLIVPLSLLTGRLSNGPNFGLGDPEIASIVLREIRMPRTLLGLLVGGSLGLCGAALQGLLRNPLAEPGVLGVSSGAALGAVLAFYFGLAGTDSIAVPIAAVAGSLVALGVIYSLAGKRNGLVGLVLAGIGINALAAALTSLALNFAPSPYAALEMLFWMFGSLADRSMVHVYLATPLMAAGWFCVAKAGQGLDALALGEDTAMSLGFPPKRTQSFVIIGTALSVGAAVAVTGVIGFVGLVVPHLLRPLVGHFPSRLLLPSFLVGALLTVLADLAVRLMPPGPELKLGVITALVGAPVFLHLVLKSGRGAFE